MGNPVSNALLSGLRFPCLEPNPFSGLLGSQLLWQVLCSHVCYSGRICVASRMHVIFIQCRDSVPWLPCPRCALPQLLLLAVTQRPCPWTCFQVEGSVTWEPVRNTGGFSLKCFWERRERMLVISSACSAGVEGGRIQGEGWWA